MSLRIGLAGYGHAGAVFHAPLIAAVDGLELVGVATRSRGGWPELLDAIDVLVVATPNASHAAFATAALERGRFVVVDKPLAPTAAAARPLVHERLTVFQNRRWDGDFLTLRRRLDAGEIGAVTRFESRFERWRPDVAAGAWRESAADGGGVLLDLGPHLVDQAVLLFGAPVGVYGEVLARRPGTDVDDDAFIALEHAGGERSHLWMSMIARHPGPRFRVSGLGGGFISHGLDPQESQLRDGIRPGDAGFGAAPGLDPGRYVDFYVEVGRWARGEGPAPVDPADAVRVLEILERARDSSCPTAERGAPDARDP